MHRKKYTHMGGDGGERGGAQRDRENIVPEVGILLIRSLKYPVF